MEWLTLLILIVHNIGLTFGVGASTFALTFYINALADGEIDASERRFMHIVYVVLRIGMTLIGLALLGFAALWTYQGNFLATATPVYFMESTFLGIIVINAVLMTMRIMPMRFGPVLAGGSWYSSFLITVLPVAAFSYLMLWPFYIGFLFLFFIVFSFIKARYSPAR
ncbi:MAG: hypothetical protein AAB769_00710 [Patescibacteria group bacterium]